MNVPIRILSITNLVFWALLIAFIASAGYSMKDVNLDVGEPVFNAAANGELTVTLPLVVDNKGYHSLKSLNITTAVHGEKGNEVAKTSTFVPIIVKGYKASILHNVTLNVRQLVEENPQLLLNDGWFGARITTGFNFAEIIPVQLSTNFAVPWGAPFSNLAVGQPQHAIVSPSSSRVTVTVSFENHASFNLTGIVLAKNFDTQGVLLAESQIPLFAQSGSNFAGELCFVMPLDKASSFSESGQVKIFFSTSLFEYGPVVTRHG